MSRMLSELPNVFRSRIIAEIIFCSFFLFCSESAYAIIGGERVDPRSEMSRTVHRLEKITQEKKDGKWIDMTRSTCTGLLVDSRTILTARHCVEPRDENGRVKLSVYFQNPNGKETKITAGRSIKNPDIDLAILIIDQPAPTNAQLTIPSLIADDMVDKKTHVYGYGKTTETAPSPKKLHHTYVNLQYYIHDELYFRTNQSSGRAACQGDSGGPAYIEEGGRYKFIGILSNTIWVDAGKLCNWAAKYINVNYIVFWLKEIANQSNK